MAVGDLPLPGAGRGVPALRHLTQELAERREAAPLLRLLLGVLVLGELDDHPLEQQAAVPIGEHGRVREAAQRLVGPGVPRLWGRRPVEGLADDKVGEAHEQVCGVGAVRLVERHEVVEDARLGDEQSCEPGEG